MILSCDAAQLEWRTIVQLSQDEVGKIEILDKQDTHSLNEKEFELPSRLIAKIYLFRTIFRGSGWSFANDPNFMHVSSDPAFWDEVNVKFFTKYHGIDRCHQEWKDIVLKTGKLETPFGRSFLIPMAQNYKGELKIPWTTLTNYPVQGTGADVMMIARISFFNRVKKLGIPLIPISTIHDSIVVDIENKYVQETVNLFHQVFDDLPKNISNLFGYDWNVPLDCECKVGINFKDNEKVKRTDVN